MITQYIIPKDQFHSLLRAVGVLQEEEEILLVNNIQLQDPEQKHVAVLVEQSALKKTLQQDLSSLTAKELGSLLERLVVMAQFLQAEYEGIRKKFIDAKMEYENRQSSSDITEDGIPKHVEEVLDSVLKDLLK